MADSVEQQLRKIIAERLSVQESQVTPEANLMNDLGADSLDVAELVMQLEETFNMRIPDEDAEKIKTVRDAEEYIKSHSGAQAGAQ